MLFNRINHLFDQFNLTFDPQSDPQKWKFLLNSTALENYGLGNMMISDTFNTSEFIPQDNGVNFSHVPDNNTIHFEPEPLFVLILVTVCYFCIFVAGILGNVITCTVISRNKSMHTATNYYLFNLAISDLILLLSGMPQDTYNIWLPHSYRFTNTICILQGLLSETSTNATVLTITSFTIERYIAICHPFRQHTMSKLSRAIKFIMGVWVLAFILALPQAIQFGVVPINGGYSCTVQNILVEHSFEISSFLFFVGPMTLICVLYVLIGVKLHKSKILQGVKRRNCEIGRSITGQARVIRMLIAVAIAFFLCWAPFHAQRLMAVYGKALKPKSDTFRHIYTVLTYVSGVLYFMSTCINPLLYSIMSHKFRNAFKQTILRNCGLATEYKHDHTYSMLSRCNAIPTLRHSISATNTSQLNRNGRHEFNRINTVHKFETIDSAGEPTDEGQTSNNTNNNIQKKAFAHIGVINENKHLNDDKDIYSVPLVKTKLNAMTEKIRKNIELLKNRNNNDVNEVTANGQAGKDMTKITSKASINSTVSSTISNSSLQEVDEDEFNSEDLAKYMNQINSTIRCNPKNENCSCMKDAKQVK